LINSGGEEGRAISGRILASQNGVALVVSARISVNAGHVVVGTSAGRNANIISADVVVIAFEGGIDICVEASSDWIAEIVSAGIVIIAVDGSVLARSSSSVARISRASVVVIARDGLGIASSVDASDCRARNIGAVDSLARIALSRGKWGENASACWVARIGCANVVVIADLGNALASSARNAVVICA